MMQNLSQRERVVLAGGAVTLLLMLLIFGMILPYRSAMNRLDERIARQRTELQEALALQAEYQRLQAELARSESKFARSGNASVFSAIEEIASRLGFRDRLVAMRPQPTGERDGMRVEAVIARLEKIQLDQFIRLLRAFASSRTLLNVTSMQIRTRFDDSTQLDIEIRVETLKRSS